MNRTLEQERAADALARVKDLLRQAESNSRYADRLSKYSAYTKSLPATILMNGLGQAAISLLARGDEPHVLLYRHLQEWLCRNDSAAPYPGHSDLISAITENGRESYLRAQAEAMAWLTWLKKFTEAYLVKPDGGDDSDPAVQNQ